MERALTGRPQRGRGGAASWPAGVAAHLAQWREWLVFVGSTQHKKIHWGI